MPLRLGKLGIDLLVRDCGYRSSRRRPDTVHPLKLEHVGIGRRVDIAEGFDQPRQQ